MLVTFKSKAAADVVMYKEHAKRILDLLNKDIERGVITVDEAPSALAKLSAAIEESRTSSNSEDASTKDAARPGNSSDEREEAKTHSVSFATRAYPFLTMLRAAQKERSDIAWGI